jgi:hypothetical protein
LFGFFEARCIVTGYAVDVDGSTLIRTWPTGRGQRAAVISVLPVEVGLERSLALAAELSGLSAALWRCYTHPASAAESMEEGSEGRRRQQERDSFGVVVGNVLSPELPNEEGALVVGYDPVQEYAHRVGRALLAVGDPGLREAVRAEVEAELEAVEMAERGDLTGRAVQAVVLSRAGASPVQVSAASAVLHDDPLGGRVLLEAFDPTAASVAAAHYLKAAVDAVANVSGIDASGVLPTADDYEAVPFEAPAEVLSLLGFSQTVYPVVVGMVADAMLVAEGVVSDLGAILIQQEEQEADEPEDDDEATPVRVTLLDPSRPALDLLEDLLSAIRGCRLLYEQYVEGEDAADVDARFCADVRAEAERQAKRLM